jgi:hypothetical protein
MVDVTPDMAHWTPPGQAHPIGSLYAHMVISEDVLLQGLIQGGAPLYAGPWQGKTGLADPENAFNRTLDWARAAKVDLDAMRSYARAVYAATDNYVATLTEADLDRMIDLSAAGMGQMPLGDFLAALVMGHVRDLMGEISALKGVQGAKGYPF